MQCDNCGYIHFKLIKKCTSCSEALVMGKSMIEMAEETGFTIFEGIPSGVALGDGTEAGMEGSVATQERFGDSFDRDDFDLDLEDAVPGNGSGSANGQNSPYSTGVFSDIGPNDFELDLSEALATSSEATPASDEMMDFNLSDFEPDDELDETAFNTQPDINVDTEVDLGHSKPSAEGVDEDDIQGLGLGDSPADSTDLEDDAVNLDEDDEDEMDLDFSVESEVEVDSDISIEEEEPELEADAEEEISLSDDETDDLSSIDTVLEESDEEEETDIEFNLDSELDEIANDGELPETVGDLTSDEGETLEFDGLELDLNEDLEDENK